MRIRAWREAGATLWFMVLGAGLLATSAPPREAVPTDDRSWSVPGPVVFDWRSRLSRS